MNKTEKVAFVVEAIQQGAIVLDKVKGELEVRPAVIEGLRTSTKQTETIEQRNVYLHSEATSLGKNNQGVNEMEYTRKQLKLISDIAQQVVSEGHFKTHDKLEITIEGSNSSLDGAKLVLTKEHIEDGTDDLEIVVKDAQVVSRRRKGKRVAEMAVEDDEELEDLEVADDVDGDGELEELEDMDMGDEIAAGDGEIKVIVQAPDPDQVEVEVTTAGGEIPEEELGEDEELGLELEDDLGDDEGEILESAGDGTAPGRKTKVRRKKAASNETRIKIRSSMKKEAARRNRTKTRTKTESRKDRTNRARSQRTIYDKTNQRTTTTVVENKDSKAENTLHEMWGRIVGNKI